MKVLAVGNIPNSLLSCLQGEVICCADLSQLPGVPETEACFSLVLLDSSLSGKMGLLKEYCLPEQLILVNPPETPPVCRLRVQTFGNFEVFCDEKPLHFQRSRTRELFAYLIDRRGAGSTMGELISVLWEGRPDTDTLRSQLRNLIADLRKTLHEKGVDSVLWKQRDLIAVDPGKLNCDYYRFLAGDCSVIRAYRGEYMSNYSWAEPTAGALDQRGTGGHNEDQN